MDFMFDLFPIFFGIIFIMISFVFVASIVKSISQGIKNNNSPKLNVNACVVTKRTSFQGGGNTRAYNYYFVTFEVESGDRIELEVMDSEYSMLVEGDKGKLFFQGTRYIGFTRIV